MAAKNGTKQTPTPTLPQAPAALPEAPASASAKMLSPSGIEWLLTTRDHTVNGLLHKVEVMETHLLKDGWIPAHNGYRRTDTPSAPPATNGTAPLCPTHGVAMKPSKHGSGFYCSQKVADDDGTGKPVYCKQTVSRFENSR